MYDWLYGTPIERQLANGETVRLKALTSRDVLDIAQLSAEASERDGLTVQATIVQRFLLSERDDPYFGDVDTVLNALSPGLLGELFQVICALGNPPEGMADSPLSPPLPDTPGNGE